MTEDFLQFAWKTLSFRTNHLRTRNQESVRILDPGMWNFDQGPDFLNARIKIGKVELHGHVEIHIHGDEWYRHGHHKDPMYAGTILHVVYEKSRESAMRLDGTKIPELVIGSVLDPAVWQRFESLRKNMGDIPCKSLIQTVPAPVWNSWLEVLARERLLMKSDVIRNQVRQYNFDWGHSYFMALSAYFGGTLNRDSFVLLAKQIPFRLILKHHTQVQVLETLLLGTAGFLNYRDLHHPYELGLKGEWAFLQNKYGLEPLVNLPIRYMRMRPAAFPEIRLSQMADFLHQFPEPGLFTDVSSFSGLIKSRIQASEYWSTHIRMGEPSAQPRPRIAGEEFIRLLVINVLLPFVRALQTEQGKTGIPESAWSFYHALPPEKNRITRIFESCGLAAEDAPSSQAQIQLYKQYCLKRNCLKCAVGKYLIAGKKEIEADRV